LLALLLLEALLLGSGVPRNILARDPQNFVAITEPWHFPESGKAAEPAPF
jgi:hypothetical protein